jgi:hypothetical protein
LLFSRSERKSPLAPLEEALDEVPALEDPGGVTAGALLELVLFCTTLPVPPPHASATEAMTIREMIRSACCLMRITMQAVAGNV